MKVRDGWEEKEALKVRFLALALDTLMGQGVEVTREQYKRALAEAVRRSDERYPASIYSQEIEAVIDWRLEERRQICRI
jgi:hypothetical protein